MIKIRNRRLALLLVLAMLATMFVSVGTASAATDNIALTVPTVGTSANNATLGTLRVTETEATIGSITGTPANPQQVTITLPSGINYTTAPAALAGYVKVDGTYLTAADVRFVSGTDKTMTIEIIGRTSTAGKAYIEFPFVGVSDVTIDGPDADVAVEIYSPNSGITQGKVIVATSSSAGTTATVLDDSTVAVGTNKLVGTIRIAETRANSIKAGNKIKVVAPDGVDIVSGAADVSFANWTQASFGVGTNADGYSQLAVTVNPTAAGQTPGFVRIDVKVDITDRDLRGPLEFTVKGDNVTTQKVVLGKVSDYNVEAVAKGDPKTVRAGYADQELQKLTIKEGLKDSFVDNRDFTLELPSYAHWFSDPTITVEKGNGTFTLDQAARCTIDNQRHKLSFTYTGVAAPTKTEFTFEDLKVFLDADAPEGDLVVVADGKAIGGKYEAVLAKVVKPVKATAEKADVKIGMANQAAPDITITEPAAGLLKYQVTEIADGWDKNGLAKYVTTNQAAALVLDLPDGVKFAGTPTVKVTAGDLKLKEGNIKLIRSDNQLSIPIDKTSNTASTIVVSNIKYTLDRTVPEGDLKVKVTGNAVDNVADSDKQFADAVTDVVNAITVTPAPSEQMTQETVFTFGSTTYKLNGVDKTASIAPFAENNRTYTAIRDVAYALGITENNIMWDQANQTVTLMKGDKVVQLKLGSKVMTINGAAVTMDVAVGAKDGYTTLPASWVAQAFGATATYDAAANTVTIK